MLAAGATALSGGLAGCGGLGGSDGEPVRFGGEIEAPPVGGEVASGEGVAGGEPRGDLRLRADVFDLGDGRLLAFTTFSVFSGATQYDSAWEYDEVSVVHDWSAVDGELAAVGSDLTVLEGGRGREPQATLKADGDGQRRRWRLKFPEAVANGFGYRFRSVFEPATSPSQGDPLAAALGRATLTNGTPVVGEATPEATVALAHGDEFESES